MDRTEWPHILAPAGDEDCFLAALAAGADAIYLGLKRYSARMKAKNFDIPQLTRLCELAARHNCKVEVAFNNILRPHELDDAWQLIRLLASIPVSGLIIQDLALIDLSRQAGFRGSLSLSTLSALTAPAGLEMAANLGIGRVVLPRELSIDEMRLMAKSCPQKLGLECFVHGALCYSVSGRCWWSSYLGGKSGLRGSCVQPCRRVYAKETAKGFRKGERYFACLDLQLGEMTKLLLDIPEIDTWKIEGRKKGPHYVYHAVTAYKILRDYPQDAKKRKMALEILDFALGRPGVKARFLAKEQHVPMAPGKPGGSGKLVGHIKPGSKGETVLRPQFELLPKDYLRIGSQDEHWHSLVPVARSVPKAGNLVLRLPAHKTPRAGTPVYLVDRREPELEQILGKLHASLKELPGWEGRVSEKKLKLPVPCKPERLPDIDLQPRSGKIQDALQFHKCLGANALRGIWLRPDKDKMPARGGRRVVFWLPPVIWPDQETEFKNIVLQLIQSGFRNYVCNSPWQRSLFPKDSARLSLIAGPFCNLTNCAAMEEMKKSGFCAAFVSPELSGKDMLALAASSPIPTGCLLGGYWPVSLSRFGLSGIDVNEVFKSPMGETFWARNHGGTIWIYPSWPLNICEKRQELLAGGVSFFALINENPPKGKESNRRPGLFNWETELS